MPDKTCATCSHPVHNQRIICPACEAEAKRLLSNQTALRDDLWTEYLRQARKQEQNKVRSSGEAPLPVDLRAAKLLERQHTVLTRWVDEAAPLVMKKRQKFQGPVCRRWCDHRTCQQIRQARSPGPVIPVVAVWLIYALPVLRNLELSGRIVAGLRSLNAEIIALIDSPPMRTRFYAGPCPEVVTDSQGYTEPCPGQVEALVPADEKVPPLMRCPACKTEYSSVQWARAGDRIKARQRVLDEQRRLAAELSKRGVA